MPTANSSHFLFGFCFGSLLIKLDPNLLQSLSALLFPLTSPVSLCLPSAFSPSFLFLFGEDDVDPPCSLPLGPPPNSLLKGSGSSQPGNCSALLPALASFPQPLLAVQQSLLNAFLRCLEEGEGERVGFPMGFHPPVPVHSQRPCRWPESHLTSLAVPSWHTRLCSMLSHPKPLGSRQRSLQ